MAINVVEKGENIVAFRRYYGIWKFTLYGSDCISCNQCIPLCPEQALLDNTWSVGVPGFEFSSGSLAINVSKCIVGECDGQCTYECPTNAIEIQFYASPNEGSGDDNQDPNDCLMYPQTCHDGSYGVQLSSWLKSINKVMTLKSAESVLQSEAMKWGMTTEIYIADKIGLIAESGNLRALGKVARYAGLAGVAYGTYSAVVALGDGNLTANELLGIASTTLGVIALVPGVGTIVGLSGLALIGAGSLVLGLISNSELGKDTTIAKWDTRRIR